MSDGGFHVSAMEPEALVHALARIEPAELLIPDNMASDETIAPLVKELGPRATLWPAIKFDSGSGERALKAQFHVAALDAFGTFSRAEIAAAGAVREDIDGQHLGCFGGGRGRAGHVSP